MQTSSQPLASQQVIPSSLHRYFWGDDLTQLDLTQNRKYIMQVILERGDENAVKWLFSVYDKASIKQALSQLKLSKKTTHFWNIYFS